MDRRTPRSAQAPSHGYPGTGSRSAADVRARHRSTVSSQPRPPTMSDGVKGYTDDDTLENEVDSMLLEAGHAQIGEHSTNLTLATTATATTTVTTSMLVSLLTLILTSLSAAQLTPYAATHSRSIALSLPLIFYGASAVLSGLWLNRIYARSDVVTSDGVKGIIALLTQAKSDKSRELRRTIYSSGALNTLSLLLTLLEARRLDAKVWQALDVGSSSDH